MVVSNAMNSKMNVPQEISFTSQIRGSDLTFNTTWGLFSPKSIDSGTRLLIECIEIHTDDICLDLGCGYGAVGIAMAKCAEPSEVYLVDKDFVAVDYARKNIETNKLDNCHVLLSNGFYHLPEIKFDIIASNLPANVGNELIKIFLNDAKRFLNENGRIYVVTISGLKEFIKRNFIATFGNYKKIKQRKTYTVSMAILT